MDIMQSFPSSYLRAGDLNGKTYKMVMKEVLMEDIGGDHKAVLYFQNADKGIVLNKTNATAIADQHGSDTDNWGGHEVEIFPATTMFKGQNVPCIRVRAIAPAAAPGAVPGGKRALPSGAPARPAAAAPAVDLNDDIPF